MKTLYCEEKKQQIMSNSLEDRIRQSSRRGSAVAIISNPLEEDNNVSGLSNQLRVVKLSDTRQISIAELKQLCDRLQVLGDNQAILDTLETEKQPFMFTCTDLIRLLNVTTSIKTKLAIVNGIAPRLSDPKAGLEQVTNLFRFAEEKSIVEDAFKSRIQTLTGAAFSRGGMLSPGGGRGAGRGKGAGRGFGHRPSLESSGLTAAAESASSVSPSAAEEDTAADDSVSKKPFSS